MLGVEVSMEIRVLSRHGLSLRAIARKIGCSRNTVRRYLREDDAARYKQRPPRPSKLDPYKAYIIKRLDEATPEIIPAKVLMSEIQARGYRGGYTIVKMFVAGLKVSPPPEPVQRFETEPGEQMQVDWAVIRRGTDRLSAFVATLGWSRAAFVEFVTDERVETLIACHEHAFLAFGGIPREILYDNMKTVVLERDAYGRGRHRLNPLLVDFAGHCGFRPRLCQPYRACTKGKVERFIRYLRQSFWVPLSSRMAADGMQVDRQAANAAASRWLREVANARVHATTQAVPADRLLIERQQLQPLVVPYGGRTIRQLHQIKPTPSIQHPLSTYEAFAGVAA